MKSYTPWDFKSCLLFVCFQSRSTVVRRLFEENIIAEIEDKAEESGSYDSNKSQEHPTRAAIRKRLSRQNVEIRVEEQKRDTIARRLKRADDSVRIAEQAENTVQRRTKRADSLVREAEQAVDTDRRKSKRADPLVREAEQAVNTAQRRTKRSNPIIKEVEQRSNTEQRRGKRTKSKLSRSAEHRINDFRNSVQNGCIYICVCCNRNCYKSNVTEYSKTLIEGINKNHPTILQKWVPACESSDAFQGKHYICNTCKKYLTKGRGPPMSVLNGLSMIDFTDTEGNKIDLSELEATLIAKNIIFMKIFQLPKSRWSAVKDKTVNVPIPETVVLETIKKFPRMPSQAGIIPIKLKRKKEYKNYVAQQYIRPEILKLAISTLKSLGNPHYQFVDLHADYEEECRLNDPDCFLLLQSNSLLEDRLSPNNLENVKPAEKEVCNGLIIC